MAALNALIETLALALEPAAGIPATIDGRRAVVADSGTTVDLNLAAPQEYEPDTLYAWPARHDHALAGAGNPPEEREDFSVQFVYAVERSGEEPQLRKRRDVSDALDARAAVYAARVAGSRSKIAGVPAPWANIISSIQHDTTVTFGVRGIGVLVTGYRIVSYP